MHELIPLLRKLSGPGLGCNDIIKGMFPWILINENNNLSESFQKSPDRVIKFWIDSKT